MRRLWRDHSLSIVLFVAGAVMIAGAFQLEPGQWFDLWLGLGCGTWTVVMFYGFAGFLRERNKPEDPV